MTTRKKAAMGGALVGLALLALTASPLFAQTPPPAPTATPSPTSEATVTHEQMDQMMDAMHGPGTSQRMHEAMGQGDVQRGEQLMQQYVDMMNMMQQMQGMMGGMSDTMGGMPGGMMGGQNGQSTRGMMGR